jgi:acyl carrier protein
MDNELSSRVIQLAADQVGILPGEVTPESHFQNDLGFDSLDMVELIMEVEEEFGVRVPDEDAQKLVTVGEVVDYLRDRVGTVEKVKS